MSLVLNIVCYYNITITVKSPVTDIWKLYNLNDIDIDIQWLTYPVLCTLQVFQQEGRLPCQPWFREQFPSCSRSQQNHVHHQPKIKGTGLQKDVFMTAYCNYCITVSPAARSEQRLTEFANRVRNVSLRQIEECPVNRCSSIEFNYWWKNHKRTARLRFSHCSTNSGTQKTSLDCRKLHKPTRQSTFQKSRNVDNYYLLVESLMEENNSRNMFFEFFSFCCEEELTILSPVILGVLYVDVWQTLTHGACKNKLPNFFFTLWQVDVTL